jgi:ATP-dependent DNA ligase
MLARLESKLPRGARWWYEPKLDGFRGLLLRRSETVVELVSRNRRDLSRWFPEIVGAGRALPVDILVDGEIVIADGARAMVSNTPCQHYLKSSFNKTGVRSRGDLVERTSTRSISY